MNQSITPAQMACRTAYNRLRRAGLEDSGHNRKLATAMRQMAQSVSEIPWIPAGILLPKSYAKLDRPNMGIDLVQDPRREGDECGELYFLPGWSHSVILHSDLTTVRRFADDIGANWLDELSAAMSRRDRVARDAAREVMGPA